MSESPPPSIDVLRVLHERPDECAQRTLTRSQMALVTVAVVALVVALVTHTVGTLLVLNATCIVFYIVHSAYKFWLVYLSLDRSVAIDVAADELHSIPDEELPSYTVLVPLFRESAVLKRLVTGLGAMDYPADKLDIMLLIEEDDAETGDACRAMTLPPQFRPIIVPESQPKTKPKACNYGLDIASSDLLVIYDAEDRPERDQLRKAAVAFSKVPEQVVCLQAKLNYYNQRQNLLTRWFTAEYSVWFDLFLPGLVASGAPIPLGGTSNHFRIGALKELGGWDPFNVTEDADLGVRLHKHGYHTAMIDSTTWEEANSHVYNWIRQRSRWVKGYLQTYLVHTRHPLQLMRQLGLRAWFGFQMTVAGALLSFLLNPIYWLMTALWFATKSSVISAMFPPWVWGLGTLCLFVSNFVFMYLTVAGCVARGYYDLVKYCVLTPVYWLLMSIGAYKAFGQVLLRPHYWEKTVHGLYQEAPEDA